MWRRPACWAVHSSGAESETPASIFAATVALGMAKGAFVDGCHSTSSEEAAQHGPAAKMGSSSASGVPPHRVGRLNSTARTRRVEPSSRMAHDCVGPVISSVDARPAILFSQESVVTARTLRATQVRRPAARAWFSRLEDQQQQRSPTAQPILSPKQTASSAACYFRDRMAPTSAAA
jgi:hypothetical protein